MNFAQGWAQLNPASMAIGAGSSLLGGLIGGIMQRRAEKRQLKNNMKLMDYQNDINVQNWNMQNEYNTPTAQLERYVDAGFAPNQAATAILGGNAGTSASPVQGPTASVNQGVPMDVDPVGDMLAAAQISNVEAQTKLTQSQQEAVDLQNMFIAEREAKGIQLMDKQMQEADKRMQEADQNISESISRMDLNNENKDYIHEQADLLKQQKPWIIKQAKQTWRNLRKQFNQLEESIKLTVEEQKTQRSMQSKNYAEAAESGERVKLIGKQEGIADQEILQKSIYNIYLQKGVNPDAADAVSKAASVRLAKVPGIFDGTYNEEDLDEAFNDIDKMMNDAWTFSKWESGSRSFENLTGGVKNVTGAAKDVKETVVPEFPSSRRILYDHISGKR